MNMDSITREKLLEYILEYIPEYESFIPEGKNTFTALEVLELEEIPAGERLSAVICGEFIRPSHLNDFACRCAERALGRIKDPDPRSAAAIQAKRAWLCGEITDGELAAAHAGAMTAVRDSEGIAKIAAWACAWAAAVNSPGEDAREAADDAAWVAAWDASNGAARKSAWDAAWESERAWQVETLTKMLKEAENNAGVY